MALGYPKSGPLIRCEVVVNHVGHHLRVQGAVDIEDKGSGGRRRPHPSRDKLLHQLVSKLQTLGRQWSPLDIAW